MEPTNKNPEATEASEAAPIDELGALDFEFAPGTELVKNDPRGFSSALKLGDCSNPNTAAATARLGDATRNPGAGGRLRGVAE